MTGPISVILSGFGWWARNRTVMPLLKQHPEIISVEAVTSLGRNHFERYVKPEFEKNDLVVPRSMPSLEHACQSIRPSEGNPVAVLITTPNALHFDQAKAAIEAGCHVYVDRPIVTRHDDLQALVELADEHKVFLFTGTQRRLEDPFRYLKKVVTEQYKFSKLKRIRCRFAASHLLSEWRRDPNLSGGGIVTDSGHHLLDIAAWLVEAAGTKIPASLEGAAHFRYDEPGSAEPVPVETEAVGHIELPDDILLCFDFSYNAPEESIYEQVELYDQGFNKVVLTRDQAVRTPLPATVTHQLQNGQFVGARTMFDQAIRTEAIRFAGKAQNTELLRLFIGAVKKGYNGMPDGNTLEARNSISTWHLMKEIYRLAQKKI